MRKKLTMVSFTSLGDASQVVFVSLPCDELGKVRLSLKESDRLRTELRIKPGSLVRFG